MTVAICQGCGRRASSEEVHCAACGRPLVEGDEAPPSGWMTADVEYEPVVKPLPLPPQVADLSVDEQAALFVPVAARRGEAEPSLPEAARKPGSETGEDDAAVGALSLPGGHGWRVRVSAANAANARREIALSAPAVKPRGRRRLPRWVFAALVVAILATSAAAALLVVIHVLHS